MWNIGHLQRYLIAFKIAYVHTNTSSSRMILDTVTVRTTTTHGCQNSSETCNTPVSQHDVRANVTLKKDVSHKRESAIANFFLAFSTPLHRLFDLLAPPHYLLKPSSTSPHTLETSSPFIKMGRLPRSEEMRSRKEDSEDEESDDDSADSGSFVVAAKATNSQQWSTSRRHSDTKKRKKHTNEEGVEWSESQQKKDIIAAFLDPDSGIHTLSIPEIFEEYAADHGWIKSNATSNIRTIKKQYEGGKGPFSEKEVNKTEPFKTRTTKSKACTLLLKVHMFSEQSGVENMTIEQLHQSQACFRQYPLNDFQNLQC